VKFRHLTVQYQKDLTKKVGKTDVMSLKFYTNVG
jgi:hypothetical protein